MVNNESNTVSISIFDLVAGRIWRIAWRIYCMFSRFRFDSIRCDSFRLGFEFDSQSKTKWRCAKKLNENVWQNLF